MPFSSCSDGAVQCTPNRPSNHGAAQPAPTADHRACWPDTPPPHCPCHKPLWGSGRGRYKTRRQPARCPCHFPDACVPPHPPPPPRSRRVRCSQAASRRMHYKRTLAEGCRIQGQPDGKASRQANPAVHWEVVGRCSPWSAHPSGPRLPASTPSAAPPALPLRRDRARRLHRRLSFVRRRRVGPRLPGSLQLSYCRRAAA